MKLDEVKHRVLPLGRNTLRQQNMLGACSLESSFAEKVLGILVDSKGLEGVICDCLTQVFIHLPKA